MDKMYYDDMTMEDARIMVESVSYSHFHKHGEPIEPRRGCIIMYMPEVKLGPTVIEEFPGGIVVVVLEDWKNRKSSEMRLR